MNLPPLKSLRYFMIAAKHKSLTKAALELNVTHSAISHQLKFLEEYLGQPLFRRVGRRLELTEMGLQLQPGLERAFRQIIDSLESIKPEKRPLVVTTLPSFAARWLLPRLGSFRQAHPGIDVHLSTTSDVEDLVHGAADIGIRYGAGSWPDLVSQLLSHAEFFPLCAPSFLKKHGRPATPLELSKLPLLGDPDIRGRGEETWRAWFRSAGIDEADIEISLHFDTNALMLQAAIDGLGIGLSNDLFVKDDLKSGRLIRLFDVTWKSQFSYYLVHRPYIDPRIKAFSSWLLDAIKEG